MHIIGLTGGIGSGKSTVAAYLQTLGAPVIDADAVSRALTAPGGAALSAIRECFGSEVFAADGTLDRKALAARVFADPAALAQLNAITHPRIFAAIEERLAALASAGEPAAVVDMPLLFETGYQTHCHQVWLVAVGEETQIARVMARDGCSRQQALSRIASQMPLAEKAKLATHIIQNDGAVEAAYAQARALWEGLHD